MPGSIVTVAMRQKAPKNKMVKNEGNCASQRCRSILMTPALFLNSSHSRRNPWCWITSPSAPKEDFPIDAVSFKDFVAMCPSISVIFGTDHTRLPPVGPPGARSRIAALPADNEGADERAGITVFKFSKCCTPQGLSGHRKPGKTSEWRTIFHFAPSADTAHVRCSCHCGRQGAQVVNMADNL
eukprot:5540706-Amphidinium_carterae.1